jgi:hypothetical protein
MHEAVMATERELSVSSDDEDFRLIPFRTLGRTGRGGARRRGGSAVHEQLQVAVFDMYHKLRKLPDGIVHAWACSLHLDVVESKPYQTLRKFAGWLLDCSADVVLRICRRLGQSGPAAVTAERGLLPVVACRDSQQDNEFQVLCTLVRAALAVAVDGRPLSAFGTEMLRHSAATRLRGLELTRSKYLNASDFAKVALQVAGEVVDATQSISLQMFLPNLGIASDIELTFDAVNVGQTKGASYGKHHVLILATISSHARDGTSQARFIDALDTGISTSGATTSKAILEFLKGAPWRMSLDVLAARLASIPVDGALTGGGPNAEHTSTRAAGMIFDCLRRPHFDVWDLIHRWNNANKKAVLLNPRVKDSVIKVIR